MSATKIGLSASDVTLRLLGPADEMDDDGNHVPAGQVALVITDHASQYEVTVVGTAQTLRDLVYAGFALPVPDGVPLVDAEDTL